MKEDLKPEKVKLTKEEKIEKAEKKRDLKSWRLTTLNPEHNRRSLNLLSFDFDTNTPEWTIMRLEAMRLTKDEGEIIKRLLKEHHNISAHLIP